MNVREAIEILQECDPEATIIVATDEEGNGFRRANIGTGTFCDQDGELISCHPDDIKAGEYEGWEDEMFSAVEFW